LPWEETDEYIRSGHRSPEDFQEDSFRTITIDADKGIKAVIGKPKGKDTTEVQSYLFDKSKDWTVEKAKAWFEKHKESKVKEHVSAILPFKVLEKIVDKPLKIRGVAMTAGMSRNFNIYMPEELQAFTQTKLRRLSGMGRIFGMKRRFTMMRLPRRSVKALSSMLA